MASMATSSIKNVSSGAGATSTHTVSLGSQPWKKHRSWHAGRNRAISPTRCTRRSATSSGVIVFESDEDLDPKVAYTCYADRWLLELVFNRYKNDEGLDRTNVQNDFPVIGSEFINFISTVMTCRMLRKATTAGLLDTRSYGDLITDLSEVWRDADAPEPAATNDGHWVHTLEYEFEELVRDKLNN